ncbi:MAG: Bcr/CflA family multidrug efflux MFS transporter [Alphaproteobacteria bacterium]|nr:Bcr/CflA family multidrug efflux MFS transporter [Alphaproteobacteria bacterium]
MIDGLKGGPRPDGWRGDGTFVATLGLLLAITPMAVDMYLPALPSIGRALDADQDHIQLSLSGFFLAFAAGQLVWGPIGDRFGRRGPSLVGLILFVIGSIGCWAAGDAIVLAGWRVVEAFGAAAATVLARAMVRDVFDRNRSASVLSLMMLVMGVAPMLAPIVGSQILKIADWRMIFVVLATLALVPLVPLVRQPETLPPERRRSVAFASVASAYIRLLSDKRYLGYVAAGAGMLGAMFAYISGSPFIYIEMFGVGPDLFGLLFGLNVAGMMMSSYVNSRLALRFGSDKALRIGLVASVLFALALVVFGGNGSFGLAGVVVPLFLFLSCMGLIGANSMAGALADHPQMAGAASALSGFVQFAVGAAAGMVVAARADGTPGPMCQTILLLACAGALANFLLVKPAARR